MSGGGVSMGGNSTKHQDMKMASGDLSLQAWSELQLHHECQENVELAEDRRTARFRQRLHTSVITSTRPLKLGDVICISVSGSGHAWAGLVYSKPPEAAIRASLAVKSERRDYLLHFRLKKTEANVQFIWEDPGFILVERKENGVLQQSKLSSQSPLWPVVDILFGDVKVTMEIRGTPQVPPLTFDPSMSGANIQLSAGNLQASPLVEFPRSFCWAHRELKPSEVVKLEILPVENPRWFWIKLYLTKLQPEVLSQSKELSLFHGVPKSDYIEVKKVRNHKGVVELMLVDLGDRRELTLTCQAKMLGLPLKQWAPDTKVFLCLELFRVEVQISSYIAPTSEQLYKQSYALDPNRRLRQDSSGDYLHPIHHPSSPPSSSSSSSKKRPVASVPPITDPSNQLPPIASEETRIKTPATQDESETFLKQRYARQASSSSSSLESLDRSSSRSEETQVLRPFSSSRTSGRSEAPRLGLLSEQETSQKIPVGGQSSRRNQLPRSTSIPQEQSQQAAVAAYISRQHSVPVDLPPREYSEDGYDDFTLAEYGQHSAEERVGYESLLSLNSPPNKAEPSMPGGPTPSIEEPNSRQSVQNLVARFEELKEFADGTPKREAQGSMEQSNLALELELEWLQQHIHGAIHSKSGTKADEDAVKKLDKEIRKMSVRYKGRNTGKPPFYCKLRFNYMQFLDSMNALPIAEYLFSRSAITEEEMQDVAHESTPTNKSRKLMSHLLRRPNAEEKFREALQHTEQQHLLPLLEENASV